MIYIEYNMHVISIDLTLIIYIFQVKMGDEEQLLLEELQDSLEDIGYTKVDRNQHSVRLFLKKYEYMCSLI